MKYPDYRILLFAREPVEGRVKTRLAPVLGEAGALDLHRQLLRRQIDVLNEAELCPAELWVDGDPAHQAFAAFRGERQRQVEGDLGDKMLHAARRALDRHAGVLLIGSDCPGLDAAYLEAALAALQSGLEAVLGPAEDGGYVLLGLRRAEEGVFAGIEWGGPRVLEQTRARLEALEYSFGVMTPLPDIDRAADLEHLTRYGIFPMISRRLLAGKH